MCVQYIYIYIIYVSCKLSLQTISGTDILDTVSSNSIKGPGFRRKPGLNQPKWGYEQQHWVQWRGYIPQTLLIILWVDNGSKADIHWWSLIHSSCDVAVPFLVGCLASLTISRLGFMAVLQEIRVLLIGHIEYSWKWFQSIHSENRSPFRKIYPLVI